MSEYGRDWEHHRAARMGRRERLMSLLNVHHENAPQNPGEWKAILARIRQSLDTAAQVIAAWEDADKRLSQVPE